MLLQLIAKNLLQFEEAYESTFTTFITFEKLTRLYFRDFRVPTWL